MEKEKQKQPTEKVKEPKVSEKEQALIKENEELVQELKKAQESAEDYKDKWVRNVAEFDNYKKRNAKIWTDAYGEGQADAILKILPIGDNLDIALSMELDEKTLEGLKLLKKKYNEVLTSMEISEINPVGETFNPEIAEAIMQVESGEGEKSDTVKQVFQKGYKLKDKIIRYAKVSVTK